jgi:hypothetical protein
MENKIPQQTPMFPQQAILDTVAALRASEDANVKPLTENSRVNEQQLFAAFTYLQLQKNQPEIAKDFLSKLRSSLALKDPRNSEHFLLDATRGILQEFRNTKTIPRRMFIKIRQVSLGLSQLDSVRDSVNMRRITEGANDTALRSVKTAMTRISENSIATRDELRSFVGKNKARTTGTTVYEPLNK